MIKIYGQVDIILVYLISHPVLLGDGYVGVGYPSIGEYPALTCDESWTRGHDARVCVHICRM